jgi:fucose 4-O-acetylase-like acetyltransferase
VQFLNNIHRFRSLAIIGIVTAHCLASFDWTGHRLQFKLLNTLANESSIWFFFIAGFLFLHLSQNFRYREFLIKKAKYIILPYLVVSIPALIGSLAFYDQGMEDSFNTQTLWMKIWLLLATGKHLAPLWFVPTIALIFLTSPLLLRADRARWPYFALLFLIPLSAFTGRDGLLTLFGINGNYSVIAKAVYLFPAFFFGMMCRRYYERVMIFVARWKWYILTATIAAFTFSVARPEMHGIFAFKILAAPLLVYALQHRHSAILDRIEILGHASFGIFFVHCYFLVAIKMALVLNGYQPLLHAGLLNVAGLTAAILALSLLMLCIVQWLFGKNSRMLVGCNMPLWRGIQFAPYRLPSLGDQRAGQRQTTADYVGQAPVIIFKHG